MYQFYVIKADDDIYKVGVSSNAMRRMNEAQTDNHELLAIVVTATFPDEKTAKQFESGVHKMLSPYWMHGEWFRFQSEVVDGIVILLRLCDAIVEHAYVLSNRQSGAGYSRVSSAVDIALDYLQSNPDAAELSVRELGSIAGVGKDSAAKARNLYLSENGHSN